MSYVEKRIDWQDTADENYIVRHWLGHLTLRTSYWINGVVIPFSLSFAVQVTLAQIAQSEIALQWIMALDVAFLVFSAALWIWSIVGIWRSAGYHEERGGSAGWSNVARAVVVLQALGAVSQSHDRFLYLVEGTSLAFGKDPMGDPAGIALQSGGKTALVDGNITAGLAERFKHFIEAHPEVTAVSLRSNGGRMLEADRMAKLINRRGLDTEAQEFCMSACTLLLLAGRERAATADARVGFHQPQFPGLSAAEQRELSDNLRGLYIKAGVDAGFLDKALSVAPQDMWFPTVDEMLTAGVITTSPIVVRGRSKMQTEMRNQQLQRYLDYSARQIDAAGRVKLDEITTRTGARATPRVLTIRFVINGYKSQMDVGSVKRELGPVLKKQVCEDRKMSLAVDAGATFVFSYYDLDGAQAFTMPISECETGAPS